MRTTDRGIRRSICNFVNMICGSDVNDVSSVESQCECLLTAIVVCSYLSCYQFFFVISTRMEMKMKFDMRVV